MADHSWLEDALVLIMTMREDDAAAWDPDAVAALAQSFSVDALGFSVGGVTAFYPTEIKHHLRSPSLGDRDLVGQTITALEKRGIAAIGRIDPSLAPRQLYDEHPDWFARDATGKLMPIHGRYCTCPSGGYYWDFIVRVTRELLGRYSLGGLWANAAQFSPWHVGRCLCPNCRSRFRSEFGAELPAENWDDMLWRQYNEWRYRRIAEWNRMMHEVVRSERPGCAWLPLSQVAESWDHTRRGGWDFDYTEPHTDGMVLEAQRRYTNIFWPGLEARYLHTLNPAKPASVTVSYFLPWWRFYGAPVPENRVWTAQIVAHGAAPWIHITGFFEKHFDRRGLEPFRGLFRFLQENKVARVGMRSQAKVALVYSRHTLDNFGRDQPESRYLDHFRGAFNALMDQRIPFDVVSDKRADPASLARYKAVLLPNVACMGERVASALAAYTEAGGHVVATFQSGFFDEWGQTRTTNALRGMEDLVSTGAIRQNMLAAYGRISQPHHPLLRGITNTDVLPLAGDLVYVTVSDADRSGPLNFIPPVESSIGSGISVPEYNRIDNVTDYPLALHRKWGRGSILYLPWQPDAIAFRYGLRDLFRLIGNAVRLASGWQDDVVVEGPGLIDLALMGNRERTVLHLINFSSHGSFNTGQRRLLEEIVPLQDLKVRLRLPGAATSVRLAVANTEVRATREGDTLSFTIPKLEEFEQVIIPVGAGSGSGS